MIEKVSPYASGVAEPEMGRLVFDNGGCGSEAAAAARSAAIDGKAHQFKLAAAKLAQAGYHLDALKARLDFLEARCGGAGGGTKREQAELEWARGALPVNSATVARLTAEVETHRAELEALLASLDIE